LSSSIFALARRDRLRFCRRIFSIRCSRALASPFRNVSILSTRMRRARNRLIAWERSRWHLTERPVGTWIK